MKKFILIVVFCLLISPKSVFAHSAGLLPFFKVNGKIAPSNPLQTVGIASSTIPVPQDFGPDNYLVNQPVNFDIDTTILSSSIPSDILKQTSFSWNFGDGTQGEGIKNTHSYTKSGSYILYINANYSQSIKSNQLIESILINILPDLNYKLPQAKIVVNNQQSYTPLSTSLNLDLINPLQFDASQSVSGSSKIIEYHLDYGDGSSTSDKESTHSYNLPLYFVSPSLEVKDELGFISETFVDIKNSNQSNTLSSSFKNTVAVLASAITLFIVFALISFLKLKKLKSS